jgi:hypothetical protein
MGSLEGETLCRGSYVSATQRITLDEYQVVSGSVGIATDVMTYDPATGDLVTGSWTCADGCPTGMWSTATPVAPNAGMSCPGGPYDSGTAPDSATRSEAGSGTEANASANLLINGSFEATVVTAADSCQGYPWCLRSFTSTPGWTQFLDGVDLISNNYKTNFAAGVILVDASDGVQFLDSNQAGALGGVYQEVPATAGATYTVHLDTTAWGNNTIGGTLGYELYDPSSTTVLASGSYTDKVGGAWITRTLSAKATSSTIGVRIQGLVAIQAGMAIDNVILTSP